ncbi:hypothetical protein ACOMHN_051659 [Nucella lapillus]
MTSYSRYSAGNPLRMSIAVVSADALTSVAGAFVFFKQVAYLTNQLGEPVETVTKFKGAKLAYIIYPESILRHRMGPFLSVLFFLALSGIGITSQVAFVHVLTTALFDKYPWMAKRRALALFVLCLLGFLVALPFTVKALLLWTLISKLKQTPGTIAAHCLAFVPLLGFLGCVLYTLLQAPRAFYRKYQRTQTERATWTMSGDTPLTSRMGEVSSHSGPSGIPHRSSQSILKKSGASRYNQVNPGTSAVE